MIDNHLTEVGRKTNSFGERLREAMDGIGIRQSDLIKATKIRQQTISYLLQPHSPATGSKHNDVLADILGVNREWLKTGLGEKYAVKRPSRREIPVFAVEDVPEFLSTQSQKNRKDTTIADQPVSERTFALDLTTRSMTPIFELGDRVIVDPNVVPVPGDAVVAIQTDGGPNRLLVFGKYRAISLKDYEVRPSNDDYQPVSSNDVTLIGTVVEHRRYPRKR